MERNQVLYSRLTGRYYFVPVGQRLDRSTGVVRVSGKKIDVTSSVKPFIAYMVAKQLRQLSKRHAFDARGTKLLLETAHNIEKEAGIDEAADEG